MAEKQTIVFASILTNNKVLWTVKAIDLFKVKDIITSWYTLDYQQMYCTAFYFDCVSKHINSIDTLGVESEASENWNI